MVRHCCNQAAKTLPQHWVLSAHIYHLTGMLSSSCYLNKMFMIFPDNYLDSTVQSALGLDLFILTFTGTRISFTTSIHHPDSITMWVWSSQFSLFAIPTKSALSSLLMMNNNHLPQSLPFWICILTKSSSLLFKYWQNCLAYSGILTKFPLLLTNLPTLFVPMTKSPGFYIKNLDFHLSLPHVHWIMPYQGMFLTSAVARRKRWGQKLNT